MEGREDEPSPGLPAPPGPTGRRSVGKSSLEELTATTPPRSSVADTTSGPAGAAPPDDRNTTAPHTIAAPLAVRGVRIARPSSRVRRLSGKSRPGDPLSHEQWAVGYTP